MDILPNELIAEILDMCEIRDVIHSLRFVNATLHYMCKSKKEVIDHDERAARCKIRGIECTKDVMNVWDCTVGREPIGFEIFIAPIQKLIEDDLSRLLAKYGL